MPTQQVVNNTSTQTTLTTTAGTVTTSPITQTVNGYSTLKTSISFFSASMVGGIITVRNPEITTIGQTAGKDNLVYPASQIGEITNVYSSFSGLTRKLSGSYDFSVLMVQNSTTARVAQVGGFKNSDDDTLGSFNVLLAQKPDGDVQWTEPPTSIDYYDTYIVNSFLATNNFTASYIQPLVVTQTENSSSFADIILSNIEPATGDVYKVKTLYKPSGQFGDFIDLGDTILERQDILIDTQSFETGVTVGSYYENFGVFENLEEIQKYWSGSKVGTWPNNTDLDITYDMDTLMGGARLKPGDLSFSLSQAAEFTIKPAYNQRVYKDTEYIVTFNIANDPDIATYTHTNLTWIDNPRLDIYVSGSKITRSENAFLNVLANGASLLSNFNSTFSPSPFKQINGPLGTRIGSYISKPIPETVTSCAFRFKALEDASINLKFIIRYGAFIISDIHVYANKETGYSPNYTRINKRIPTEHLNTPLTFKFQYFDRFGRQANLESVAYGAVFDGDNIYIDGTNNLLTGSVFISNQVGSGLELAGVNSGFMRSVGYDGFISASNPAKGGAPGWMIWSGSVLPSSGDNYGGVGLELIADADNYLQYRTYPQSIFVVKAESFFLGADGNYISGSNGNLEISSSNFILSPNGNVSIKGNINAVNGTFQDVDIRGKIATMQVSGSSTTSPNSGLSRVMLEAWHSASNGSQPSVWYTLTTDSYISSSQPNISTRLPWYVPSFLWNPDTKTESLKNSIESASYNIIPNKIFDFEYDFSRDGTKYGLPTTGSIPYAGGLGLASKQQTWNASTSSWSGIRLENIRITPANGVSSQMNQKVDYVLVTGISNYVGIQYRVIIKRGTTTITAGVYTDEFDVHDYTVRENEHPVIRIPIGAQSSYQVNSSGNYVYVNPRVDLEIQWRNDSYIGAVPNPLIDVTARGIALHETKIYELPRIDNLAVRNLRLGDAFRSSVVLDVIGSNLSSSFGGANPSTLALRNAAFDVTQSQGYHDLKLRDIYSLGTINAKAVVLTGSLSISGSTIQTGNNTLIGTTTLTGSILVNGDIIPEISSSFDLGSETNPWRAVYIQSGSISIQSDIPGGISAVISNANGNITFAGAGFQLKSASFVPFEVASNARTIIRVPSIPANDVGGLSIIGSSTGVYQGVTNAGGLLHLTSNDGVSSRITSDAYGTNANAVYVGRKARGTAASPLPVGSGDVLTRISSIGWTGTDYGFTMSSSLTSAPTSIDVVALENYTTSSFGSRFNFYSVPTGSTVRTLSAQIDTTGITIPSTSRLFGTASWAENALTASYVRPLVQDVVVTGSLTLSSGSVLSINNGFYVDGQRQFNYGQFSSTTTQSGSANTAYSMTFDTTDYNHGVSLVSGSRITVANTGLYNLQFSSQLENTANTTINFDIWFAYTGSNVANSNTTIQLTKVTGGNGKAVAAWNFAQLITSGSYMEIMWSCDAATGQLHAAGIQSTPTRPATPSVIATLTQIA